MNYQQKKEYTYKPKSIVREWVEVIVISTILFFFIRTFVVQAFKIPSGSMLPTLQIGDHILVSKFIFYFAEPERGDVIVFKYPRDKKRDFIKRMVGDSGETIRLDRQQVYINEKPLQEEYAYYQQKIPLNEQITPRDNFGPLEIPTDSVFVMGDNRESSMDSRYWGPLKKELILGQAFIIYWSIKPYLNPDPQAPFYVQIVNYLISFKDRIRWERLGMIIR